MKCGDVKKTHGNPTHNSFINCLCIRKGYKRDNTLDIDQSSNKVRTPLRNNCRANILSPKAQFTPSKKPIDISLTDNGEMKGLPND